MLLNELERVCVALVDLVHLRIYSYVTHFMLSHVGRREIVWRWTRGTCGLIGDVSHFWDRDICKVGIIGRLELTHPCLFESTHGLFTHQSVYKTAGHRSSLPRFMDRIHFNWLPLHSLYLLHLLFHLILFKLLLGFELYHSVCCYVFESKKILMVYLNLLLSNWKSVGNRLIFVYWSTWLSKSVPQLSPWHWSFTLVYYFHRFT